MASSAIVVRTSIGGRAIARDDGWDGGEREGAVRDGGGKRKRGEGLQATRRDLCHRRSVAAGSNSPPLACHAAVPVRK